MERIDTISAIRKMAAEAGMSLADISEQTGKGRKNLSSRLYLGNRWTIDEFDKICDVCGYRLVLEKADGTDRVELRGIDLK